jgi:hypothetical protein
MLSVVMLSVAMLSVVMLSVAFYLPLYHFVMLNVIMLNVIMLSVVAPKTWTNILQPRLTFACKAQEPIVEVHLFGNYYTWLERFAGKNAIAYLTP